MRVAIWGAGKMGQTHAAAYEKMGDGVTVTYVVECDHVKAQAFAERFGCEVLTDVRSLGKGSVDIIDICLPTNLHGGAIRQAAEICRAILCEKPICLELDEYRKLKEDVEASGCTVMVGQVLRFWNGYVKAREILQSGEIGSPKLITCKRRQKMPSWSNGNWLMDSRQSGGILMDLCIHDVDYLYWIMGLPKTVGCEIVTDGQTTLHSLVTLAYDGCCASIVGSWGMPKRFHGGELEAELEIVGDKGMLLYRGGNSLELITDEHCRTVVLEDTDGYENELRYFVDCIRDAGYPARADICSVEGTMKILRAARAANAAGQIVELDE